MADKLQAFRWKGPGVLHIQLPTGERIVVPAYEPGSIEKACIVRKSENLSALGAPRIAEFIKDGKAEAVNWVEGLEGMLKEDNGPALADAVQAQEIATESASVSKSREDQAKADKEAKIPGSDTGAQLPSSQTSSVDFRSPAAKAAGPVTK